MLNDNGFFAYFEIMVKRFRILVAFGFVTAMLFIKTSPANAIDFRSDRHAKYKSNEIPVFDTVPPPDVMAVVSVAIKAVNTFDIRAVADLYTPNAVIVDNEPPYSWNGPTAGVQWINAVEKLCQFSSITKLKGVIDPVNVYQVSADDCYIVVPVHFTYVLPGKQGFSDQGAFAFALRWVNGKWLIKSQVWMPQKAMDGDRPN